MVLRLRHIGEHTVLTLKGPASFEGPVKHRTEHEVEVADGDRLQEIFNGLGFGVAARYEKDREAWRLSATTVVLDHTPMGDFVEVEGPADDVEEMAHRIGLDAANAVPDSYLRLWLAHRERHTDDDLPVDMVFAQ
jgi:adenylate cyclase class 2